MLMCPIDDSQSLLISISFQFSLGKNVNIYSKSMLIYIHADTFVAKKRINFNLLFVKFINLYLLKC
jgi:hypothetical protein